MKKNTSKQPNDLSRSQLRRRDDIIQAGLKIFDRDGFESAKMVDIAKEADVAKGTLYLYFDTKIDLLEGVISTAIIPALQQIGEVGMTHKGSATERLKQQIRIAVSRMASSENRTLLRHMIAGSPKHQRITQFYYDNVVLKGLEHIKATLDYGVETGEFHSKAKNIDPLVLVGAPVYIAIWNILFKDMAAIDPESLANDFLELVLDGLKAD